MKIQAIVIGLGQFGMSLARSLVEKGAEVIAVDSRDDRVRLASEFAADAVCFDATDEAALSRTAPKRRDVCICAIGDESRESSIICTALLRQMGASRVIARANDPLHERILRLVGAHEIVNPEAEFGERLANIVVYEGLVGEMRLGDDLVITELRVPGEFVGKTLAELALPKRHGVAVAAIRRAEKEIVVVPDPRRPLEESDVLITISREGAVQQILEKS